MLGTLAFVTIEERLRVLEAMAASKGVDISTNLAAVQRRVEAVEQRLYDRALATPEQ